MGKIQLHIYIKFNLVELIIIKIIHIIIIISSTKLNLVELIIIKIIHIIM